MNLIKIILKAVYPSRCAICDGLLSHAENLICIKCEGRIRRLNGRKCKVCGRPIDGAACMFCHGTPHSFDRCVGVFAYEGEIKESLMRFKFLNRAANFRFYADEIYKSIKDIEEYRDVDIVMAVPVHKKRLEKRGYNQAELIAKELARLMKRPYRNDIVIRVKKTLPQKDLDLKERRANIKGAFKIKEKAKLPDSVLIVDDILTSGTTLDAMASLLKKNGVGKVYTACLTLNMNFKPDTQNT